MKAHAMAAALVCFAGTVDAFAQSTVTTFGRLDLTAGRNIGSDALVVQNGTGSRFGLAGTEDLGGGLQAFFKLEHRFNADTGSQSNAQRFWQHSFVGLQGRWGRVWLGRDYTPAYWDAFLPADPFGNATIANFTTIVTGGISPLRNDDQVTYQVTVNGFSAAAAVSIDKKLPPLANFPHRPVSASAVYTTGALKLAYGYENPGAERDHWHALTGSYKVGSVTARLMVGEGRHTSGSRRRGLMLAGSAIAGEVGVVHAAYGQLEDSVTGMMSARLGIGYYHALSKRTLLYSDVAHDRKAKTARTGFDLGIRHSF